MMISRQRRQLALTTIAGIAMLALPSAATCFTTFGGSVNVQFSQGPASFTQPGARNVAGVIFGSLAACAGLTHWPVVGTVFSNGHSIVLTYRAMTVDAAGRGAVDTIVSLNPLTLSGPLQLHNDRNNFSNTSTLNHASCVPVPLVAATAERGRQQDESGNR